MAKLIRTSIVFGMLVLTFVFVAPKADAQGIQILGAWHCYDDGCAWATVPNMTTAQERGARLSRRTSRCYWK
jgi:hypothetical protein